ncbi:Glyoxylase, beta-lactamase superfamily II [[Clostridium] fimetarium]|uniref:Glyoxylase, beta-lactamase superfamily II n=2 Tax=[Clostridium] fimetarium TaxID=99656 RepID=A0A1I0QBB5_9FIRM|nr:Glyoxylase, beta-lactamase superfamily II [[Clostridium] fimetarium]
MIAERYGHIMDENKIRIITKVLGSVSTNCYFIVNVSTKDTIIIDPADSPATIKSVISENGLKPQAILLTHGHFDHILAANQIKEKFNIPVIACDKEKNIIENSSFNLSSSFGANVQLKADEYVQDGTLLNIAGFSIKVIHTPGHTEGSVCYYFLNEDILISGDTLFNESVGRSDFPTGSASQLIRSVKEKLLILPGKTIVYPGHGDSTTIEYEKKYNPFCQ